VSNRALTAVFGFAAQAVLRGCFTVANAFKGYGKVKRHFARKILFQMLQKCRLKM
jgi:hypothetical protein